MTKKYWCMVFIVVFGVGMFACGLTFGFMNGVETEREDVAKKSVRFGNCVAVFQ